MGLPPSDRTTRIVEGAVLPIFSPPRYGPLLREKAISLSSGDHAAPATPSPPALSGTVIAFSPFAPATTNAPVLLCVHATRSPELENEHPIIESSPATIWGTPPSEGIM